MWSIARLLFVFALTLTATNALATTDTDHVFKLLVEHAFGPATKSHASSYYQTRFFTARLQSRMSYIISQYDESDKSLSQSEADQLNLVAGEINRAAHKMFQSKGCLSYDLTLCDGKARGQKQSEGERVAVEKWIHKLDSPFEARVLSRDEASEIHTLARDIQDVLLAHAI
ncbi:hypothetical protein IWW50_005285 [Coemansia erecta]|nr:hypothetical protein GGF43_004853 [Coemansia sp. RSA 2618]KAJ2819895.1 hypothetical protein IWW50_005285 [Coemansia erecta]